MKDDQNPLCLAAGMTEADFIGRTIRFRGTTYIIDRYLSRGRDRMVFTLKEAGYPTGATSSQWVLKAYLHAVFRDAEDARACLGAGMGDAEIFGYEVAEAHVLTVPGGFVEIQQRLDDVSAGAEWGGPMPCWQLAESVPPMVLAASEAARGQAWCSAVQQMKEAAYACFTREPGNENGYGSLAVAFCWAKDYDAGLSAINLALEINPSASDLLMLLGVLLEHLGRSQECLHAYESALEATPVLVEAVAHLLRAGAAVWCYPTLQARFEAEHDRLRPADQQAIAELLVRSHDAFRRSNERLLDARDRFQEGNVQGCLQYCREALAECPTNSYALFNMWRLSRDCPRTDPQCLDTLEATASLDPRIVWALQRAGSQRFFHHRSRYVGETGAIFPLHPAAREEWVFLLPGTGYIESGGLLLVRSLPRVEDVAASTATGISIGTLEADSPDGLGYLKELVGGKLVYGWCPVEYVRIVRMLATEQHFLTHIRGVGNQADLVYSALSVEVITGKTPSGNCLLRLSYVCERGRASQGIVTIVKIGADGDGSRLVYEANVLRGLAAVRPAAIADAGTVLVPRHLYFPRLYYCDPNGEFLQEAYLPARPLSTGLDHLATSVINSGTVKAVYRRGLALEYFDGCLPHGNTAIRRWARRHKREADVLFPARVLGFLHRCELGAEVYRDRMIEEVLSSLAMLHPALNEVDGQFALRVADHAQDFEDGLRELQLSEEVEQTVRQGICSAVAAAQSTSGGECSAIHGRLLPHHVLVTPMHSDGSGCAVAVLDFSHVEKGSSGWEVNDIASLLVSFNAMAGFPVEQHFQRARSALESVKHLEDIFWPVRDVRLPTDDVLARLDIQLGAGTRGSECWPPGWGALYTLGALHGGKSGR